MRAKRMSRGWPAAMLALCMTLTAPAADDAVATGTATPIAATRAAAPVVLPPAPPTPDFSDQQPRRVVAVLAGDLIVVDLGGVRAKMRLAGIDAPARSDAAGRDAHDFLERLLLGEAVYVDQHPFGAGDELPESTRANDPAADAYALPEAFIYRAPDGLFVNLELVRLGYARHRAAVRLRYGAVFAFHQAVAQKQRKGLWAPQRPPAKRSTPTDAPPAVDAAAKNRQSDASRAATSADTVYVTRTGVCYHREDCKHLSKSKRAMSLKEAKQRGYSPCGTCDPPE